MNAQAIMSDSAQKIPDRLRELASLDLLPYDPPQGMFSPVLIIAVAVFSTAAFLFCFALLDSYHPTEPKTWSIAGMAVFSAACVAALIVGLVDRASTQPQVEEYRAAWTQEFEKQETERRDLLAREILDEMIKHVDLAYVDPDKDKLLTGTRIYRQGSNHVTEEQREEALRGVSGFMFASADKNPGATTTWVRDAFEDRRPCAIITYSDGRQKLVEAALNSDENINMVDSLTCLEPSKLD